MIRKKRVSCLVPRLIAHWLEQLAAEQNQSVGRLIAQILRERELTRRR